MSRGEAHLSVSYNLLKVITLSPEEPAKQVPQESETLDRPWEEVDQAEPRWGAARTQEPAMKGCGQCPGESVPDQVPVWAVTSQFTFQSCSRFVAEPSLQDLNILKVSSIFK